jgi:hypothetical protein
LKSFGYGVCEEAGGRYGRQAVGGLGGQCDWLFKVRVWASCGGSVGVKGGREVEFPY